MYKLPYKDIKEAFYSHSGSTSAVVRNLAIAGFGIIWVFKTGDTINEITVPEALKVPMALLIGVLMLDLFQYLSLAISWHIKVEKNRGKSDDEEVEVAISTNYLGTTFFYSKTVVIIISFFLIGQYAFSILKF